MMGEARIQPGRPVRIESRSPSAPFLAVFEDDGETGYFYALTSGTDQGPTILDAVQVYVAPQPPGGDVADTLLRLVWSPDGERCGVLLDGELQAVFDFRARIGAARSGFPPPPSGWRRVRGRSGEELAALLAGGPRG